MLSQGDKMVYFPYMIVCNRNYYITQYLYLITPISKEDDNRVSPKQYPEFGQDGEKRKPYSEYYGKNTEQFPPPPTK